MAANLKRGRAKAVARQKAVAKAHGAGSKKHKAAMATTKKYNQNIKKAQAQGAVKRAVGSSPAASGSTSSSPKAQANKARTGTTNTARTGTLGSGGRTFSSGGGSGYGGSGAGGSGSGRQRKIDSKSVKYVKPKRKKIKV